MEKTDRIFVAGHAGLVGSAIVRRLRDDGYASFLTATRSELDLTRADRVEAFFRRERPEYVFLAAGEGGGIGANLARPAEFIRDNLLIQASVLQAAQVSAVRRLLLFGCSCVYPKDAAQPMREAALLTGPVERSSEPFAVAKIAGIKMAEAYARQYGLAVGAVVPATVYGPNDDFDPATSHVLAALLRKFHDARRDGGPVVVWGTGAPRREFIHADDLADACLFLMRLPPPAFADLFASPAPLLNVGTGRDISIRELAALVARAVGFTGPVSFDASRPDGVPRKLLDSGRLRALGWAPSVGLEEGVRRTCQWYNRADVCPGS